MEIGTEEDASPRVPRRLETIWKEVKAWAGVKASHRCSHKSRQKPYLTPAKGDKRLASRFCRSLPRRPVPPVDGGPVYGWELVVTMGTCPRVGAPFQGLPAMDAPTEDPVDGDGQGPIRDLSADERCSQAALDSLVTTGLGQWIPETAKEDDQSEASEWELERRRGDGVRGVASHRKHISVCPACAYHIRRRRRHRHRHHHHHLSRHQEHPNCSDFPHPGDRKSFKQRGRKVVRYRISSRARARGQRCTRTDVRGPDYGEGMP